MFISVLTNNSSVKNPLCLYNIKFFLKESNPDDEAHISIDNNNKNNNDDNDQSHGGTYKWEKVQPWYKFSD